MPKKPQKNVYTTDEIDMLLGNYNEHKKKDAKLLFDDISPSNVL